MADTDPVIQSRLLVGRDDFVSLAERRLAETAAGHGQLLFVAGEAGIGKTRLLAAIAAHAEINNIAVVRAAAYPGDVHSNARLLDDLAENLGSHAEPAIRASGERLSEGIGASSATGGDAHYRRRVRVGDLVAALAAVPDRPMLIILEDLHWADQLSLDVLARVIGRLATRPVLIAGAYRSNELFDDVPLHDIRTRLLTQRLAEEIRLTRLDLAETGVLIDAIIGRAAPAQLVAALHDRSDGIPLHIEELLATVDIERLSPSSGAAVAAAAVPETLGHAIRDRSRRLSPDTRDVAAAAAVIGRSFDFDLLVAVTDADPDAVAIALRELQEAYFVGPGADAVTFDFRHALIRDTLYTDTDLPARRRLHDRVAGAASAAGDPDAFVSAHFELAQQPEYAYRHALVAARAAASMSAHSEALGLYRRAERNLPAGTPAAVRAALHAELGDEAAATDDNAAASVAYRRAIDLLTDDGDVRAVAALVPRLVAADHLLGEPLDARIGVLRAALDRLDGVPDADRERARLRSAIAAAYMLDRRLEEAIAHGDEARAASLRAGDGESAIDAASTHGSVLVFAGRMDEGWQLLEGAITRAVDDRREAAAARAYRMLGSSASVLVEYDRAESALAVGIGYAEQVELANHRHYMAAHLAHVRWATGRWDDAATGAAQALADGRGGITTRITAGYVLGYLALGRGEPDAEEKLSAAYADGLAMAELQRLSPPLWGLAEAAWCRGDTGTALERCEQGYAASAAVHDAAYLFPFLLTGVRAHLGRDDIGGAAAWLDRVTAVLAMREIPGTLPAIAHGRGLILAAAGELPEAQRLLDTADVAWRGRRRFWEGTWLQLDLAAVAVKARRRGAAVAYIAAARVAGAAAGATVIVDAADRLAGVLDGGRPVASWHPLSAREFEVARLIALGMTNRQIAERLVLAPKTISAHVEHILTKLGAGRRTEIAAWCAVVTGATERPMSES